MEKKQLILFVTNDDKKSLAGVRLVFNDHIHFVSDHRYYALDCLLQLTLNKKTRSKQAMEHLKIINGLCKDGYIKEIVIETDRYDEIKHLWGDSYFEMSLVKFQNVLDSIHLREF